MRLPLIWRPAPSASVDPAVVTAPVNLVSLAATFLAIAGRPAPHWVEGAALPTSDAAAASGGFEASVTEWDSALFGVDVHVRTVVTTRYLYSEYQPGTLHDGSESELYDLSGDPLQRVNRANDVTLAAVKGELSDRLHEHMSRPGQNDHLGPLVAPV